MHLAVGLLRGPGQSISKDFSMVDPTQPTRSEPVWQKMAQSPFNGTIQPADMEEEG